MGMEREKKRERERERERESRSGYRGGALGAQASPLSQDNIQESIDTWLSNQL